MNQLCLLHCDIYIPFVINQPRKKLRDVNFNHDLCDNKIEKLPKKISDEIEVNYTKAL